MTALGAMRATFPGLAAELRWNLERFTSAAREALNLGIIESCDTASWVGVQNFLKYNEPEGPNSVTKAWVAALQLLPECPHKIRLILRCRDYLLSRSQSFRDAIGDAIWVVFRDASPDAMLKPSVIQEKEPEQKTEKDLVMVHQYKPMEKANGKVWKRHSRFADQDYTADNF